MNGAREYAQYFKTGQYGRLYIVSGDHARGRTFHIYVLPEGATAKSNGYNNPPTCNGAVEVYGILGGRPGWTEWYGWIHEGKWVEDFMKLYEERKAEYEQRRRMDDEIANTLAEEKVKRERDLLDTYK